MDRLQSLGAPISTSSSNNQHSAEELNRMIDPTLDACCRREAEASQQHTRLQQTLEKHTHATLQRERMRRNLVETLHFSGCRCCYDPNQDGTGDYTALAALRRQNEEENREKDGTVTKSAELYEQVESHQETRPPKEVAASTNDENDDDDSDDDDSEFDYLLDEVDETVEAARRAYLEMDLLNRQVVQQHGYGVHRQLHPTRILRAAGLGGDSYNNNDVVVVHLYDPDSTTCAQLDWFLEQTLAPKYMGTKFMRCGGRSCLLMDAEFASRVLGRLQADRDVPVLIAIREGLVIASCPNLQGLQDVEGNIITRQVEEWLDRAGVLQTEPPLNVCRIRPEEDALMDYLLQQKIADDREKEPVFQCGVAGCEKAFHHEHVGIETEHQSGLIVKEREILAQEVDGQ
jgi:hypothetical protein